jgi:DNA-directed RNA polymerase specialized sigma24 family protein
MTGAQISSVLHHLRGGCSTASDRELLERFCARRDEAAFTQLLRRHGPMVIGVGRRLLRQEADAEDVFQATFLLLARNHHHHEWTPPRRFVRQRCLRENALCS